tara:strand:- start:806 stop:1417 length:612 start_codon:yes stop_codon:yes gene_type:complete
MKNVIVSAGIYYNQYKKLNFFYDEDILELLKILGLSIFPINNSKKLDYKLLKKCDGLILMGNGDITRINDTKLNRIRDKIERQLYKYFYENDKPILAICRGFQNIMDYHDIPLFKLGGHVRTTHNLQVRNSKFINFKNLKVNSYHNYSLKTLPKNFLEISRHKDKSIEIAEHKIKKILCLMFHPERAMASKKNIIKSLKNFFK